MFIEARQIEKATNVNTKRDKINELIEIMHITKINFLYGKKYASLLERTVKLMLTVCIYKTAIA